MSLQHATKCTHHQQQTQQSVLHLYHTTMYTELNNCSSFGSHECHTDDQISVHFKAINANTNEQYSTNLM